MPAGGVGCAIISTNAMTERSDLDASPLREDGPPAESPSAATRSEFTPEQRLERFVRAPAASPVPEGASSMERPHAS